MSAGERVNSYLTAARDRLKGTGLFADVRNHLDLFDLEDALKESFRTPAARIIFVAGKPVICADGGVDCRGHLVIAVITRREGRPDPEFASADAAALTRAFDTISAINADPYLGQPKVTPLVPTGLKVALSEKNSKEGLAVVAVEFEMAFLRLSPPWSAITAISAPGAPAGGMRITADGDVIAETGVAP